MFGEDRALVGERFGGDERNIPAIGVACGDVQRSLLATATDPDGQATLYGAWFVACTFHREPLAFEVGDVVVQKSAHALDRFFELIHAGLDAGKGNSICVVFHDCPPGAQAQIGATSTDVVDGRDHLGENRRMPVSHGIHERTHAHLLGGGGQCGVHGHRFVTRGIVGLAGGSVEVIPNGNPVEPQLLDSLPERL